MANNIQVPVTQTGLPQSINNAVRQMGTINIPVNINPNSFQNLAQPLGKITGLATEFEKSIAASNARVLAFGASVGIINGIQNALSDLVKSGIEVQKTLSEIGAISGQTGDELRKFGNDIFDAAKNTGNSFKVASEAALEFSRQGLSAEETIKRTNDALTLSRFTNLSAAESVDTLTAALNTFKEAGITSSEIINKLVAVDTKFAVSAEDLAKGISRAGSIAQEVGVNFDQLNAAITVAQEKTARGGSVIGNALKTIFTNIRSDKAVEALRAVGVESLNAQGQLKGAIPLLQELADKMKNMSGGERIQLLETVASKYNINILSSLLDDLNDANSKFGQAVKISAGAGNEAYERLSLLNKTLASDINRATQSLTQFYAKLSEIGVTEGLSNMLKFVNGLLDSLNKLLDSESVGGNIARGLIKGLSDIFFSVGLPIIAAIFVKLTTDIAKFGVESLKTILGINQQVRERAALEQAVVNTLIKDQQVMANILAMGADRTRQEQYLLSIYEAQIAAMQTVKNIGSAVAPGLMGAGLSATSGNVTKRSAGGYLPAQEAADVRRGVGGANPSASVVAIPNFAFGGGKFGTMIANSSEYVVPNFANGGSAIFNQDMVKAYGLPAGAQKIAAGGYIPNFAAGGGATWRNYFYQNKETGEKVTQPKVWMEMSKEEKANFDFIEIDKAKLKKSAKVANAIGKVAMLLPNEQEAAVVNQKSFEGDGVRPKSDELRKIANLVKFRAFGISKEGADAFKIKEVPNILNDVGDAIAQVGAKVTNDFRPLSEKINPQGFRKIFDVRGGALGSLSSVAGAVFETAVEKAVNPNGNPKATNEESTFDVPVLTQDLKTLFGIKTSETAGDYKISSATQNKFADQILKNDAYEKPVKGARSALGYIPNFADPLGDAIHREMSAGIPPSQISVTQDGRLRNAGNPSGLAVINSRDEPNGRIPNFAVTALTRNSRGQWIRQGTNQLASQAEIAAFLAATPTPTVIPQAVTANPWTSAYTSATANSSAYNSPIGPMPQASGGSNDPLLNTNRLMLAFGGLTMITSQLQSNFKDTNSGLAKFTVGLGQVASSVAGYASIGSMLGETSVAKRLAGRGGLVGSVAGNLTGVASLIATPISIAQAYSDYQDEENARQIAQRKQAGSGLIKSIREKNVGRTALDLREAFGSEAKNTQEQIDRLKSAMIPSGSAYSVDSDVVEANQKKLIDLQNILNNLKEEEAKLNADILRAGTENRNQEEVRVKMDKDSLSERIALQSTEIRLNEAFAANILKLEDERNKKLLEYTKQYASLSQARKDIIENELKVSELLDRQKEARVEATKNIIDQLRKSGQLSVTESLAVGQLEAQLKAGKDVVDVEKTISDLKITGVTNQKLIVASSLSDLGIKTRALQQQAEYVKQITEQQRIQKSIAETDKLVIESMRQKTNSQNELKNVALEYLNIIVAQGNAEEELLKKRIGSQAFSTPQQEADLLRMQLRNQNTAEAVKITQQYATKSGAAFENVRSTFREQLDSLGGFMGRAERKEAAKGIEKATTIEELRMSLPAISERGLKPDQIRNLNQIQISGVEKTTVAIEKYIIVQKMLEQQRDIDIEQLKQILTFEQNLKLIREQSGTKAGLVRAFSDIEKETKNFPETFAYNTTNAFRDGLRDAMSAAISDSANLGQALQGVAQNFLKTMQGQFLQNASGNIMMALGSAFPSVFKAPVQKATGGLVTGGSGYHDDVPAMLTGGEFVMTKSAVQKYGIGNLAKMNSGGVFLPGVRGGGDISGYDALRAFSTQTTTSGLTDILRGTRSSAYLSLEDQSAKLSRFALLGDDTINQEIRSAQEQGLNIMSQREAYRTQQRKAFQQMMVGTLLSAAASYGTSKLGKSAAKGSSNLDEMMFNATGQRKAYGGPTDDTPAMLMSGEYVMSRGAARKYGTDFLNSMNSGRAPRFADGGAVDVSAADSSPSNKKATMNGDINISINVASDGSSDTKAQGGDQANGTAAGIDYKKMSERIKAVVLETIQEEKRLGGSLRR